MYQPHLPGTTPVLRTTRHVFLDLPKLSPKLQEYINTASGLGGWSSNCVQVRGIQMAKSKLQQLQQHQNVLTGWQYTAHAPLL